MNGARVGVPLSTEAQVTQVLQKAKKVGGTVLHDAGPVFWGGFTSYFADPVGLAWEVARNPFWKIDAKGNINLPK